MINNPTTRLRMGISFGCLTIFAIAAAATAWSGDVPNYDFDWATITDVGNPAYGGGPNGELAGRGSVNYQYRISRLELTSGQFLEFVNTFWKSAGIPMPAWFIGSSGIQPGLQGPYELKRDIPNAAMVPVIGLNWRVSAMYCNWLNNGKSSDPASLQNGAYDISTFHTNPDGSFTDQVTHSPDAKFWIPTLDEWIKAAHYDPNRYGQGQGGWWMYPNGSDIPLIAGPPGIGQTSAGDYNWPSDPSYIPLGSYPAIQGPWGLLDTSGGASEWTEENWYVDGKPAYRVSDGAWAGASGFGFGADNVFQIATVTPPSTAGSEGLRIASSVPGPGCLSLLTYAYLGLHSRRKRTLID